MSELKKYGGHISVIYEPESGEHVSVSIIKGVSICVNEELPVTVIHNDRKFNISIEKLLDMIKKED